MKRSSPEPLEWEHWLQHPRLPENSPQGISDSENSHKGNHLNTRPASPNHQQHPVQEASSKQHTKRNYKPNHQQTGLPPHSALPIRGKTSKQIETQQKSHPIQSLHKPLDQPWKWKWSHSVMPDSLRPHELEPTRLLYPWDSPSKNTGVGGRNQKKK